ncbi:hypothetical protein Ancab_023071 [Ancistrocladus abbreviatus]
MRTRNLLSTMQRQEVLDRIIIVVGLLLFSCAVLYVVSKRIGLLKLQQKVTAAIKAGMVGEAEFGPGPGPQPAADGVDIARHHNVVPKAMNPLEPAVHDELRLSSFFSFSLFVCASSKS